MSIGTNHMFSTLTKDSKPIDGQRLCRLIAKSARDGSKIENLSESLCVSLPIVSYEEIAASITELLPAIQGMVHDAQDAIVRELRIADGCNSINDSQIAMSEVIRWLEESSKGTRVTREWMQQWFTETYGDAAREFVKRAIPDVVDAVVEQKVNVIRDCFAGFASARYSPEIPKCRAILRFASSLSEDSVDARMSNIVAKTEKILAQKEAELASDALGF